MQYRLPPLQNQHAYHSMIPPVNQGNALRGTAPDLAPSMGPRNYAMPPASYMGSAYPGVPGLQYPITYPGGMLSPRPLGSSPGSLTPTGTSSNPASSSYAGTSSGSQIEGMSSVCSVYLTFFFIVMCVYSYVCVSIERPCGSFVH